MSLITDKSVDQIEQEGLNILNHHSLLAKNILRHPSTKCYLIIMHLYSVLMYVAH